MILATIVQCNTEIVANMVLLQSQSIFSLSIVKERTREFHLVPLSGPGIPLSGFNQGLCNICPPLILLPVLGSFEIAVNSVDNWMRLIIPNPTEFVTKQQVMKHWTVTVNWWPMKRVKKSCPREERRTRSKEFNKDSEIVNNQNNPIRENGTAIQFFG